MFSCAHTLAKKLFKNNYILLVKNQAFFPVSCFLFFFQVALHACGVATDMVADHCIQAGAAFVVSPCCYGFIQNAVKFSFPKRFVPVLATPPAVAACPAFCFF